MTLTGGVATSGGAIFGDDEQLTLTSCVLTGNSTSGGDGGAVFMVPGTVIATNCLFTNNSAGGSGGNGGAIAASHVDIRTSTVSGNIAFVGGGIHVSGAAFIGLLITDCTLSGNDAQAGGGVNIEGTLTASEASVRNSTVSGNLVSDFGGGIRLSGSSTNLLEIVNSTIVNNSAGQLGGGFRCNFGSIKLESTIVAQNSCPDGPDLRFTNSTNMTTNNSIVGVADSGDFVLIGSKNSTGSQAAPLNAKLGQACFNLGATSGEQVTITFDAACGDQSVLARLDSNPPASLYAAPPARQNSVIKDPAAIKRLTI